MSRIGKLPVEIPAGVTVKLDGRKVEVSGNKGNLSVTLNSHVELKQEGSQLLVSKAGATEEAQRQWGLARTIVNNLIVGVSEGFSKQLEIQGVGYRVAVNGRSLTLSLGYSHPIDYALPDGIEAAVEGNIITISGIDKQKVGQVAAEVRALRKPEPYKGKGVRYVGEQVRRKAGKAAAKAGASQ